MLHVHQFLSSRTASMMTGGAQTPLLPAEYIKLRRTAAGLSVAAAAEQIARKGADQSEVRALIRMLETPGNVARHRVTLELLTKAFPLDPYVYSQLATQPADRRPWICRTCGCSAHDPCLSDAFGTCTWRGRGACSHCADGAGR